MKTVYQDYRAGVNSRDPRQRGMTLIELMVVLAVIATITSLALPIIRNAKKNANESATIGNLGTLSKAQEMYRVRRGSYGDLSQLAGLGVLDSTYQMVPRPGYQYNDVSAANFSYVVEANPAEPGNSGDRYFFIDESGVIRASASGPATSSSPEI